MRIFSGAVIRVLLALILVTAGSLWLSLETTRDYLHKQMDTTSKASYYGEYYGYDSDYAYAAGHRAEDSASLPPKRAAGKSGVREKDLEVA